MTRSACGVFTCIFYLSPDLAVIDLGSNEEKADRFVKPEPKQPQMKDLHTDEDLVLSPRDEHYVSSLIMSEEEVKHKTIMWNKINAGYLKEQEIKEEIRARDRETKDKKKKVRGSYKKKVACNAATAGEAIGKMLAGKKISSKINYDILKSLDQPGMSKPATTSAVAVESKASTTQITETTPQSPASRKRKKMNPPASPAPRTRATSAPRTPASPASRTPSTSAPRTPASPAPRTPATPAPRTSASPAPRTPATPAPPTPVINDVVDDYEDDGDIGAGVGGGAAELDSLGALLRNSDEDDYYECEDYY